MVDLIFKGATRPAMVLGVPLIPLVAVGLLGVLSTMWALHILGAIAALLVLLVVFMLVVVMRIVSKSDDQKLHQMVLRLQSWTARRNSPYWGVQSSAPIAYARRRH